MLRAAVVAVLALAAAPNALAAGPVLQSRAYIVENATTGDVLAQHAAGRPLPIASITKLMTVLVTLQHANLDDVVTVQPDAAAVGESSIYLRAGEQLTVRELLEAALIQSANDAADALADHVGHGSAERFVAMMNAEARRLGLHHTHFARPDGLDAPGHVSSARDVVTLARTVMRIPFVRATVRKRSADISGGRHLYTWDDLLGRFPGLIGVKTGHTSLAGWCQVAAVRARGSTFYAVVLGDPTRSQRNDDLASLLRWAISRYRLVAVVAPRTAYARVAPGFGRGFVDLVAPAPLRRPVRVDRPLVERVVAPRSVTLPLVTNRPLGHVSVWSGKHLVGSRPLVAARAVPAPGFFGKVGWYAGRTLHHIGSWFT